MSKTAISHQEQAIQIKNKVQGSILKKNKLNFEKNKNVLQINEKVDPPASRPFFPQTFK